MALPKYITGLLLIVCPGLLLAQSYLSELSAGSNDPLYHVYTAPPERSESLIDAAYELRYYPEVSGLQLRSSRMGLFSMAFRLDGEVKYFTGDFSEKPAIEISYSDLLKYSFRPFHDIQVMLSFQVYSSRVAMQEVALMNSGASEVTLDFFPFFQHPGNVDSVSLTDDTTGFQFRHGLEIDAWSRKHQIPAPDSLWNMVLADRSPSHFGVYSATGPLGDEPTLPQGEPASQLIVHGRVYHADGRLCTHTPADARFMVYQDSLYSEILTESASVPDDTSGISGDGSWSADLGNMKRTSPVPGDSFRVLFTCLATGEQGRLRGIIPGESDTSGQDIHLIDEPFLGPPEGVEAGFSQDETTAIITWIWQPDLSYSVFRRDSSTIGRFDLVASDIQDQAYLDFGLDPDSIYAYTMIARDSLGRMSNHSNISSKPVPPPPPKPAARLFRDIANRGVLSDSVDVHIQRVLALQYTKTLQPGETQRIRLLRGIVPDKKGLPGLRAELDSLTGHDFQAVLDRNESLYQFADSGLQDVSDEKRMIFWSALNLARQHILLPDSVGEFARFIDAREPYSGSSGAGGIIPSNLGLLTYMLLDPDGAASIQQTYFHRQREDGSLPPVIGRYAPAMDSLSAPPLFSVINLELFHQTEDRAFLETTYQAGTQFYQFWTGTRDRDGDGLSEWGSASEYALWRSGGSVIQAEGVKIQDLEALDLNTLLVAEAGALAAMAQILGDTTEADLWDERANQRSTRIRNIFWDPVTGFFYHLDGTDQDFSAMVSGDLKRKEDIGFLPLWAGVASDSQAEMLAAELENPSSFGRTYGVPSLTAEDPGYRPFNPSTGGASVIRQYLIFQGLVRYDLHPSAGTLAEKVLGHFSGGLEDLHSFRGAYHPDASVGIGPGNPFSAALAARLISDLDQLETGADGPVSTLPDRLELRQNYPNPFNRGTVIGYTLPRAGLVCLEIYNLRGHRVTTLLDEVRQAGSYEHHWNGRDWSGASLPSGIYWYRLKTRDGIRVRKMLLLK